MTTYISPEEMAAMHNVDKRTIYRILTSDQKQPESERRLPGAFKEGDKYRGEWKIPLETAQQWQRSARGRKSS